MKTIITKNRLQTVLTGLAVGAVLTACGPQEDYYRDPGVLPAPGEPSMVQLDGAETHAQNFAGPHKTPIHFGLDGHPLPNLDAIDHDGSHEHSKIQQLRPVDNQSEMPSIEHPEADVAPDQNISDEESEAQMSPVEDNEIEALGAMNFDHLTNISDLSATDFALTCKAIDSIYKDVPAEDIARGQCVYTYATEDADLSAIETISCNQDIDGCLDDTESVDLPIALCDSREAVPAQCNVNYADIERCVVQFRNTQVRLADHNVCEANPLNIVSTNRLLRQHENARSCIQDLADDCPAINAE